MLKHVACYFQGTIILYLFSKQTGKVANFSNQLLPNNDVFLLSSFWLANDAFLARRLFLSFGKEKKTCISSQMKLHA